MKRFATLLLVLMMTLTSALAELPWPAARSEGQKALQSYVEQVNLNLSAQGLPGVNSLFECYETFATLGVTSQDNAEVAESIELTFVMGEEGVRQLQLRVSDFSRFPQAAAACIQAASPEGIDLTAAQAEPARYVQRAQSAPYTLFEDEVDQTQGPALRAYYAYYPDQYSDGVNWLQLTLIFPLPGSGGAGIVVTPEPEALPQDSDDEMYGTNTYYDEDFEHLEIFLTPTPEPDSAANDP